MDEPKQDPSFITPNPGLQSAPSAEAKDLLTDEHSSPDSKQPPSKALSGKSPPGKPPSDKPPLIKAQPTGCAMQIEAAVDLEQCQLFDIKRSKVDLASNNPSGYKTEQCKQLRRKSLLAVKTASSEGIKLSF